jgi:hypothetical protein
MRYLVGVAALVAVCCTACGGSMALDPVAAAATKTAEKGGRLVMTGDLPEGITLSADGTFDAAGNADLQMKVGTGADMLDMRFVLWNEGGDLIMFIKSPAFSSDLPDGKTWAKIDLTKAAKAMGQDPSKLMQQLNPGSDPTQLLDMLGKASGGVDKVGTETVAGVETTHYHATIDLAKLVQENGATQAEAEQLRKMIGAQDLPVDVWIDGDGYVRRMDESFSLTMKGKTEHMSIVVTIPELGDFTIQPPTDGVADVTDAITSTK